MTDAGLPGQYSLLLASSGEIMRRLGCFCDIMSSRGYLENTPPLQVGRTAPPGKSRWKRLTGRSSGLLKVL